MISLTERVGYLKDGPEVPVQKLCAIVEVLPVEGLVHTVVRLEVALDLGRDRLLGGEGTAGDEADHEEGRRDDDPDDRDRLEQPLEDEADHERGATPTGLGTVAWASSLGRNAGSGLGR